MSQDAPSAGRFEGRVHILPVRIYYEDTDFTGLVYHANYVRYCERGRSDFLRLAGVHHSLLLEEAEPLGFAVNKLNLEFLKPARIDDALVVRSMFDSIKGPRIFITQEIERAGEILVRAEVQVCCISLTGKPRRPPVVLLDRLKPFLET
ncbi:YbgC/FadM family acyl-CoA thioesterase [Vitreimonas sp.]|uniref:YbgC/FadM family acyl-CoA thioesterase n=1 Tax=Vitreimonas sp. TaxID=3069702 RepID=UPI002EDABF61